MKPHTFCSFCGVKHIAETWPRTCGACSQTTFRNPIPVVVMAVRTTTQGLLIVKRAIPPQIGAWALPGGYVDFGETWQEAGAREVLEETGISIEPGRIRLVEIQNSANHNMLIFGSHQGMVKVPDYFQPNSEVSDIWDLQGPKELAFSTHTQMCKRYFDNLHNHWML